jgi:hypothetical protein
MSIAVLGVMDVRRNFWTSSDFVWLKFTCGLFGVEMFK